MGTSCLEAGTVVLRVHNWIRLLMLYLPQQHAQHLLTLQKLSAPLERVHIWYCKSGQEPMTGRQRQEDLYEFKVSLVYYNPDLSM